MGPGVEASAYLWRQTFQYEIFANQEAHVTVRVTFSDGSSYVTTDHVIQGTHTMTRDKQVGTCNYQGPVPPLSITSVDIITATTP